MIWLIEKSVLDRVRAFESSGQPPAESQRERFEARSGREDGLPRQLSIVGDTAEVRIEGILTPKPSWVMRWLYGANTGYSEVIEAIAVAENDSSVKRINFLVNSPGGAVEGVYAAAQAIRNTSKPTTSVVNGGAASAAYWLASQSDQLVAADPTTMFGSVGVVVSYYLDDHIVDVTSTNAPDKRPDVSTDAGRDTVRTWLDQIHDVFVADVAGGRGVSVGKVNKDFGRGGMLAAQAALDAGMIDAIADTAATVSHNTAAHSSINQTEVRAMDLAQLKAQHPGVYAAAVSEGVEQGVKQERDRVTAHLTYGKNCGAMDIAIDAIDSGVGITQSLQAKYMTAGRDKLDVDARAADDTSATDNTPAGAVDDADVEANAVADLVLAKLGGGNE